MISQTDEINQIYSLNLTNIILMFTTDEEASC